MELDSIGEMKMKTQQARQAAFRQDRARRTSISCFVFGLQATLWVAHHSRFPQRLPMPSLTNCRSILLLGFACIAILASANVYAQTAAATQTLPQVDAGTIVGDANASRWNRVVLLARPRISRGDVSALSSSVRDSVNAFTLSILATVEGSEDQQSGERRFRLREVGVGYSAEVQGKLNIVTLESAPKLGLSLSFIQRQMLSENEKQIRKLRLVARTSTLTIFDAPAILLRDGKHMDLVVRHFVWIDSRTGEHAALVWLLQRTTSGALRVIDEPIRHLPPNFREDREIHVDGQEFIFGIPSEHAFALAQLPPGTPLNWEDHSKPIAALEHYTMDEVRDLAIALNAALRNSKSQ
jgi:hypothetical protein